jgi:hypothetical protein
MAAKTIVVETEAVWTIKVYGVPEIGVQTDNDGARKEMAKLVKRGIPAKLAVFDEEFFLPELPEGAEVEITTEIEVETVSA